MNENLKDQQNVLLVKEKDSNKVKAVKGIDSEKGKLDTVSPKPENQQDFMKIDKHGNVLENFLENFNRQFKNPTHFLFFKAPEDKAEETAKKLEAAVKNPDNASNKAYMDVRKVETDPNAKKPYINPDLVKWDTFEKMGVSCEDLAYKPQADKPNNYERLLDGRKTDLMPVRVTVNDKVQYTDVRLSLNRQEDGSFSPNVHLIRHKPDLERPYFGVEFTREDKENLLKTGNLGRIVEAEFKQGEKTPVLLSLDKQTNELVAFRKEWLKVPETYKGVQLSEESREKLGNGEKVKVENMTTNDGSKQFSADVQFNADKRYFELVFNNDRKQNQNLKPDEAPKTFRKVEVPEEKRENLEKGQTVHISGMTDKNGKPYSGFITLNKETGKYDFMLYNDYKAALDKGRIIPEEKHKTQVAVNNEGKTNEATKNVKEPLNSGQTQPTEKQAFFLKKLSKKKGCISNCRFQAKPPSCSDF